MGTVFIKRESDAVGTLIESVTGGEFSASSQNDTIWGNEGDFTLNGLSGNDTMSAKFGNSTLDGGSGHDWLFASHGDSSLDGGTGNDTLGGAYGNHTLDGGSGDDILYTYTKFIDLPPSSGATGFSQEINAGSGNDIVVAAGSTFADLASTFLIDGGLGDDTLDAGAGEATITGGAGSDVFVAGANVNKPTIITITDFTLDGEEADLLDLEANYGINSLDDVTVMQVGDNTEITWTQFTTAIGDDVGAYLATSASPFDFALPGFPFEGGAAHPHQFLIGATTDRDAQDNKIILEGITATDLSDANLFTVEEPEEGPELTEENVFLSELARLTFVDVGDFHVVDFNGDGVADVTSTDGTYGDGLTWIDGTDQSVNRVNFADLGNYQLADMNGDGTLDVVSDALGGLVYYDGTNGAATRITFVDAGEFKIADMDNDGANEIVSANGGFGGSILIEADGSISRVSFTDLGQFEIGNFDGDAELEIMSYNGTFSGFVTYETDGSFSRYGYQQVNDFAVADVTGDGIDELVADGFAASIGGFILNGDGSTDRFSFYGLGDFEIGNGNGDGEAEIIANNATFGNGDEISGLVAISLDTGALDRLSFIEVDDFQTGDFDGDGDVEVAATGGTFANGIVVMDGLDIV